jgi:hypothetical protein
MCAFRNRCCSFAPFVITQSDLRAAGRVRYVTSRAYVGWYE